MSINHARTAATVSVLIVLSAGCISQSPREGWNETVEGGASYHEILTYTNTTGPFPVRAVIDVDWRLLYVGLSDGVIRWWNFSNESAIRDGVWSTTAFSCGMGGLKVLSDHNIVAACGRNVTWFDPFGTTIRTVEFSHEISDVAVAERAGIVMAGFPSPYGVELRYSSNGSVLAVLPAKSTVPNKHVFHVAINFDATLAAYVDGDVATLYEVVSQKFSEITASERVFAALVEDSVPRFWILAREFVGPVDLPIDHLRAYFSPLNGSTAVDIPLGNTSVSRFIEAQYDLYSNNGKTELAHFAVLQPRSYDGRAYYPRGGAVNIGLVYNTSGSFMRGMAIPGQELHLSFDSDGSLYVVSAVRAALGGSQLWLSYGAPDATPPVLVRHNITG